VAVRGVRMPNVMGGVSVSCCVTAVSRAATVTVRVGVASPEAAQRHRSKADGAQQQTRDVEVHQRMFV